MPAWLPLLRGAVPAADGGAMTTRRRSSSVATSRRGLAAGTLLACPIARSTDNNAQSPGRRWRSRPSKVDRGADRPACAGCAGLRAAGPTTRRRPCRPGGAHSAPPVASSDRRSPIEAGEGPSGRQRALTSRPVRCRRGSGRLVMSTRHGGRCDRSSAVGSVRLALACRLRASTRRSCSAGTPRGGGTCPGAGRRKPRGPARDRAGSGRSRRTVRLRAVRE